MGPHHHDMTASYGFGLFPLPAYRAASRGDWRVRVHLRSLADGYLGTTAMENRAVLTRGRRVWMSTGLLEQESHAWHVHSARGVVVAAGLGLGMYAYAAAMKPEVERVIVGEVSEDIIALMQEAAGFEHWACRDKVTIIQSDTLSPGFADQVARCANGRRVDYLYADIWPNFPAAEAPAETARMVAALKPCAAGWWGQELSFGQHCRANHLAADEETLRAYFAAVGVPVPPLTAGYAAFCRTAMAAHGLGERKSLRQRMAMLFGRA